MSIQMVSSFAEGKWVSPDQEAREIRSAIDNEVIARAGNGSLDMTAMLDHGRTVGGPSLRAMTFHERAAMLKALGAYINEHKQLLYDLSYNTGATLKDHFIDVDGGIGTLFVYASKGRRELPNHKVLLDGDVEQLSKNGTFIGQHICTPLQGVAVHINAFNFPVWGMLEKLAPTFLAGMPAIVKPATSTCYVTEACVRLMLESGLLPDGALQFIAGGVGSLLDEVSSQDVVTFTGSADTANHLRTNENILKNSVRFSAEQDSLNASILGLDAAPGTQEFDLFAKEVVREMTVKAGQKCTAIRRIIVPEIFVAPMIETLSQSLSKVVIGDPRLESTRMGALVSVSQKHDVLEKASQIASEASCVFGGLDDPQVDGADGSKGAFVSPMLFHCEEPDAASTVHCIEAFGPISTIMGYRDAGHAIDLANKGGGSLVASVITHDEEFASDMTLGAASNHGRIYFNNRDSMKESTGHGAPMPHMVHGGPGRAGGGEELGGIRAVKHFMQRTAVQGSPQIISAIGGRFVDGAATHSEKDHPFTRSYNQLAIGETLETASREITLADIEHFAEFTGDKFYAHMDEEAAKRNPFFPDRVAHGYLLLSFAAGLFVEPNEGPVLANTGLDSLRFMKPVSAGETIKVKLTVMEKTPRSKDYGEVRWHVTLINQDEETVAQYQLLTMNAFET